jgi:C-terminal processing protease CtpA/Prc
MKLKSAVAAGFAVLLALGGPAPAFAQGDEVTRELENARKEVERAREELQRATRELARSLAQAHKDNPRAQYFSHITDPDRPMLGIIIGEEGERRADRGLRVLAVTPGGGAEAAGLKAGDLILSVNGKALGADGKNRPRQRLHESLQGVKAGDSVKLEYERDGKRRNATLVTRKPDPGVAFAPLAPLAALRNLDRDFEFEFDTLGPHFMFRGPGVRGLQLAKLDEELGEYFRTRDGVLVIKAPRDNPLGLRGGDVIQKIDGQAVSEPVTVMDLLHSRDGERQVSVEVLRKGKTLKLSGTLPVAGAAPRAEKRRMQVIVTHDGDDS